MAQLADASVSEAPSVADLLASAVEALGGSEREGQQQMAAAVERALRTGEHLAVQAGTGTGKSLAYLVPAIRHALEADQAVVVSTATIALQAQLVDRDLPRLTTALTKTLGRTPTFAILKGRGNYLCRHKIESGAQAEDPGDDQLFDPFQVSALGRQVTRLHEWAEQTKTGDRDELVPGVPDRAWRQVSVTARECLGASRCPVAEDCFSELARHKAGTSDVVVTNHALLAIDAIEGRAVLPEHDVVVVDEAHNLVDRVTSVATGELTSSGASAAARRCAKLVDQALSDQLLDAAEGLDTVLADEPVGPLGGSAGTRRSDALRDPQRRLGVPAGARARAGQGREGRRRRRGRPPVRDRAGRGGPRRRGPAALGVRPRGPGDAARRRVALRARAERHERAHAARGAAVGGGAAGVAALRAVDGRAHQRDPRARRLVRRARPAVGPAGRGQRDHAEGTATR